jgi:predicted GTPase
LPAVGYHSEQIEGLRHTIERSRADVVLVATPIDLAAMLQLESAALRTSVDWIHPGWDFRNAQIAAMLALAP